MAVGIIAWSLPPIRCILARLLSPVSAVCQLARISRLPGTPAEVTCVRNDGIGPANDDFAPDPSFLSAFDADSPAFHTSHVSTPQAKRVTPLTS